MSFTPGPITTVSLPGLTLRVIGPDHDPRNDAIAFTLHSSDWTASIRVVLVGRAEQREFLQHFAPVIDALRHKLDFPASSEPSAA